MSAPRRPYRYRYSLRMDAAALIREARHRAGLSQAQLAAAAGTSQPAVAAYESGSRSPSTRTLDGLVRATGASLEVRLTAAPVAGGRLITELRGHREAIHSAARRRGVNNVRVFGSVARGDDTQDSDVDLLVDFDAVRRGLLPLIGFATEVSTLIGRHVDVSTTELLTDDVRREALRDAVPL